MSHKRIDLDGHEVRIVSICCSTSIYGSLNTLTNKLLTVELASEELIKGVSVYFDVSVPSDCSTKDELLSAICEAGKKRLNDVALRLGYYSFRKEYMSRKQKANKAQAWVGLSER